MRARTRERGFTLIELLVVIAIIAILAAVLFPVFMAAKRKGQQCNCMGNLKQMAVALQEYITDFGRWTPEAAYGTDDAWWPFVEKNLTAQPGDQGYIAGDAHRLWISRYIKSAGIAKCPGDHGKQDVFAQIYEVRLNHAKLTYAWNYTINAGCPEQLSELRRPSRMIAWVEENTDSTIPNPFSKEGYGNVINDVVFVGSDITSYRHNGRANVAYADGHAGDVPAGLVQNQALRPDGTPWFYEPK